MSALLEIAEAMTLLPQSSPRTVLLAFWDAEEKGRRGSRHWVANPTIPIQHVRFYLNVVGDGVQDGWGRAFVRY